MEKIVANTGAAKLIVIASAIGKNFNPKYRFTMAKVPANALPMCNFNFFVTKRFLYLFNGIIKKIGIKPKKPRKNTN